MPSTIPSAAEWFAGGERLPYDAAAAALMRNQSSLDATKALRVFRRTRPSAASPDPGWLTFLPGFPEGSYGWAKVDGRLADLPDANLLYVEYVGQGDSDKPAHYPYGTMERADLVEAQWRDLGIQSTTVVTFDYSSIVLLELLQRQIEWIRRGQPGPVINRVVAINGGLFADSHSHPWFTTPLLKSPVGPLGTWAAQRSRAVFDKLVDVLFSKGYRISSAELAEMYDAIGRRDGMAFLSRAADFVADHRRHAERWDLGRISEALGGTVPLTLVGSDEDPFEHLQIEAARVRLARHRSVDIQAVPGGHTTPVEQPDAVAEIVRGVWSANEARERVVLSR